MIVVRMGTRFFLPFGERAMEMELEAEGDEQMQS